MFGSFHDIGGNTEKLIPDAGYDLKAVLEEKVIPVPCTQENIKENVFKPIEAAMFGKQSTTQLSRIEVNEVYEVMSRWLGEKFGVYVPFPCEGEE